MRYSTPFPLKTQNHDAMGSFVVVGRNDLCPCGSGKKYKKCHLPNKPRIELVSPAQEALKIAMRRNAAIFTFGDDLDEMMRPQYGPTYELAQNMLDVNKKKRVLRCIGYGETGCLNPVVGSHSISEARGLKPISEANHVMIFDQTINTFSTGLIEVKKVSVGNASRFYAFCQNHDSTIFNEIDNGLIEPTEKQAFLLAYRSFIFENYTIIDSAMEFEEMLATKSVINRGDDLYYNRVRMGAAMYWAEANAMVKIRECFANGFKIGDYKTGWKTVVRRVKKLPFSVSAHFTPKFDLAGKRVTRTKDNSISYPFMTLNVIPENDKSLIVLTGHCDYEDALKTIWLEFEGLITDEAISQTVWDMALRNIKNLALNPAFWSGLTEEQKMITRVFFSQTTTGNDLSDGGHWGDTWRPFPEEIALANCWRS